MIIIVVCMKVLGFPLKALSGYFQTIIMISQGRFPTMLLAGLYI